MFQTPASDNILLSSSPDVVVLNPNVLHVPVEPSHGNYFEAGATKAIREKLSLDVNGYLRDINSFADDNLLLNTPVSFPIAFRRARIYGAEAKLNLPIWDGGPGLSATPTRWDRRIFRSPAASSSARQLRQAATNALTELTGRFWVSQDQRHTVRTRFRYQFLPRLRGAAGADYGSGLPIDFDGTDEEALAQYGAAVIGRVDFPRDRVRPSLSVDASIGADLWKRDPHRAIAV